MDIPFGTGAFVFIALYLVSLIVIGWFSMRSRKSRSMHEFYLGGSSGIGFIALLFTLYATQYSGNTLLGFSGRAYSIGYAWTVSVVFMTAIVICYLLFAPQLHKLARKHSFVTPTDFLKHRYGFKPLNHLATLIMVAALGNYFLAQLTAMGRAAQGLTNMDPEKAFIYGVIGLATIMLIYETMGGFKAVVWTDVIQGFVLAIGFLVLIVLVFKQYGFPSTTSLKLLASEETRSHILPPDAQSCRKWISYTLIFGLGGSLYPQAIQRIYAARSSATLKKSLAVMVFLPLTTALIAVLVGVTAVAHFPGLEGAQADRILAIIMKDISAHSVIGYGLVVLLFAAILGALMSTADSCLLTTTSMLTKDVYQTVISKNADERQLARVGNIISWTLVFLLAGVAIWLNQKGGKPTLIRLLDMKFDMLLQLVPAFMIGLHWKGLRGKPAFFGMLAGLIISLALFNASWVKEIGFHAGHYGLLFNLSISIEGSLYMKRSEA